MLRLITRGGPALCNVAVTNACNAACDFCNFARGKVGSRDLRWIDANQFGRSLDILRKRDIRYISFFGGEPLLHSCLADMIAIVVERDMGPALITNGWLLASQLDKLAAVGLKTVYISIDAATTAKQKPIAVSRDLARAFAPPPRAVAFSYPQTVLNCAGPLAFWLRRADVLTRLARLG
jgi:MoaA/NifB/PqqE/SkfB family radical SAM enzyme